MRLSAKSCIKKLTSFSPALASKIPNKINGFERHSLSCLIRRPPAQALLATCALAALLRVPPRSASVILTACIVVIRRCWRWCVRPQSSAT